jgi:signal transduction histidine kinase
MPLNSKLLAKITDGSAVACFVIDQDHVITHWNTAMENLTGIKREQMVGKDGCSEVFYGHKRPTMADLIVSRASPKEIEKHYQDKYRTSPLIEGAYEAEDFFPELNHTGKWLHFTASPLIDDDGKMIGAIETLLDITERKELENDRRYFLQQTTWAHEEERKYIARELHDDIAQILGSLSRELDNTLRQNQGLESAIIEDLNDMQFHLHDGLKSVQRFIKNLRPSLLDDLGLVPALRSLTNSLEETDGIITEFSVMGEQKRLNGEVELSLFRIVQEALNNVKKHAEASEVRVSAEFNGNIIKLNVYDNGIGFELPKNMDSLPRSGMLGLMGIRERVWLLNGTLEIDTEPGKGTTLTVTVPVK